METESEHKKLDWRHAERCLLVDGTTRSTLAGGA